MLRHVRHFKVSGLWQLLLRLFIQLLLVDFPLFLLSVDCVLLFVGLPLAYGLAIVMFSVFKNREKDIDFGILFEGFQDYSRIFVTKFLQQLYTALWALLLVVPGIIKYYSYAMTDYILKEEPEMKNNAAIEKSMAMMENNKMKLFMLDLSFIGWAILCCITLGIGFFFLIPYMQSARAAFYEDLKAQQGGNVEAKVEM